jgi:hypothetical protein
VILRVLCGESIYHIEFLCVLRVFVVQGITAFDLNQSHRPLSLVAQACAGLRRTVTNGGKKLKGNFNISRSCFAFFVNSRCKDLVFEIIHVEADGSYAGQSTP